MEKEYVSREEFNAFKEEFKEKFKEVQQELTESKPLLHEIERKIDIIFEKMTSGDKIEDLKLKSLLDKNAEQEKRIDKLEEAKKWLIRTILSSVIVMIFEAIGLVFAFLK